MRSSDSSTKPGRAAAEPLSGGGPSQQDLRPDARVLTLAEFIAFLEAVEEVVGRDERPRGPTIGDRFLL
jgi:hypothetical protein